MEIVKNAPDEFSHSVFRIIGERLRQSTRSASSVTWNKISRNLINKDLYW